MVRKPLPVWLFLGVAFVGFAAGLTPLLRDRPMNVTFLALGAFWLIIGIAVAAKSRKQRSAHG